MKQVAENLWMGGLDHGAKTKDGFTAVIALDRKAPLYDPLLQVRWPIGDWDIREQHDPARFVENLYAVSSFVWVLLDGGHRVLVHCAQGRNRAPLVCAKVLVLQGFTPEEAVLRIRAVEPQALTNSDFLGLLVGTSVTAAG